MKLFSIVLSLLFAVPLARAADSLNPELQRGLFEEEANQNFDAAVRAYQSVLTAHDSERKLAATALFRLGECYRKLGRTNDAVTQYQRLVAEFPDQATLANLGRQNLAGLGARETPSSNQDASRSARQEQEQLLKEEIRLLEMELARQREVVSQKLASESILVPIQRDLLALRRQLAALAAPESAVAGESDEQIRVFERTLAEQQIEAFHLAGSLKQLNGLGVAQARVVLPGIAPDPVFNSLLEQLAAAEGELAARSTEFAPDHPTVKALRAKAQKLDAQANARMAELVDGLKIKEASVRAQIDELRKRLATLKETRSQMGASTRRPAEDSATRAQLKELLQGELKIAEQFASEQRKKVETGTLAVGEEVRFERDVLNLKRQLIGVDGLASVEDRQRWRELLLEEIKLAEEAARLEKQKLDAGKSMASEVARLQRDVLILKRELVAFDATPGPAPASGPPRPAESASTVTDEEEKEIRRIQALIKDSPDLINAVNVEATKIRSGELMVPKFGTLLHKAASLGQLSVAKYLLENGADVGARDQVGYMPLHWAAGNGHKAMVELLLASKADVNAKISPGYQGSGLSPLHLAVEKGYRTVCETLLVRGADPNQGDASGTPPIYSAVSSGDEAILRLLLAKGAKVNPLPEKKQTPLHIAGTTNIIRILIESGAVVDARNNLEQTPLHSFAGAGRRDLVELLLAAGADPELKDNQGKTPLHIAATARRPEAIALLIAKGANPNERTSSGGVPLDEVIKYGDGNRRDTSRTSELEMLQALLAGGADPNVAGVGIAPHLFRAVSERFEDMAEALLEAGADPNAKTDFVRYGNDPKGQTALNQALLLGDKRTLSLVNLLLEHKANPNLSDGSGNTPLYYAVASGSQAFAAKAPFVEALLKHGANIEGRDSEGNTPLALAVRFSKKEMVELLLRHKADPNAKTGNGSTPLHLAVGNRNIEIVNALLAAGANPNVLDAQGLSALDYAKPGGSFSASSGFGGIQARPGSVPSAPGRPLAQPREVSQSELAERLRKAGARDWAPRPGQITVTRRSTGTTSVVFTKGTNDWNRHSLLEVMGFTFFGSGSSFPFSDFSKLTIARLDPASGGIKEFTLDLTAKLATDGCQADQWLEWGDLIDIPEGEHKLDAKWQGLPSVDIQAFTKCLARKVTLIVKGQSKELSLQTGQWRSEPVNGALLIRPDWSFRLQDAVLRSGMLLTTSDTTRVKVKRSDAANGRVREWTFDLSRPIPAADDLWLRDGDVIEVPDK